MINPYLALLLIGLLIFVFIDYVQTNTYIRIGTDLANSAQPFTQQGSGPRILVIGDSTAVGTGASSSSTSLAGLLATHYPTASIENKGVNGSKTHELIPRLQQLKAERYDLVMIHIGGNDTVRFTDTKTLAQSIRTVIKLAKDMSEHVVIVSTGNVGTARLLPFGTRWIFEKRTRIVRDIFKQAAFENGVIYVDLFREHANDPFAIDHKKYYATDAFHPSDAGYADWFGLIQKQLPKL